RHHVTRLALIHAELGGDLTECARSEHVGHMVGGNALVRAGADPRGRLLPEPLLLELCDHVAYPAVLLHQHHHRRQQSGSRRLITASETCEDGPDRALRPTESTWQLRRTAT